MSIFGILHSLIFYFGHFSFDQSVLDFMAADVLLLVTVTVRDTQLAYSDGILATLECQLWKSRVLLWSFFTSSTWNIVNMTIER